MTTRKKKPPKKAAPDANETAFSVTQQIIKKSESAQPPTKAKPSAAK